MRFHIALLACGLLAVPAMSQTQVFMISHQAGAAGGNTNNNIPYSWYPTRYQQVYDDASFDVGTPTALSTLYYRMNKSYANGSYGGQTIEIAVLIAYAAANIDSQTCTGTFASNLDNTSLKTVIKKTKFVLPKLSDTSWGIKFPFDSGVTFLCTARCSRSTRHRDPHTATATTARSPTRSTPTAPARPPASTTAAPGRTG
ncbi:MAG: hypothetical protein R3F30_03075 [Planctomycetota bacterium]